ncbi:diacylglycerol/lipid kinase family protein [Nonomuraea sp. NPDC050663]|uniref:diacylglycerol/lipid kinase family protein n=1 Tax=Nonomuraea sp. NPDC050663 TaxID=3364370 RepID=UPI00379FE99B
MKLLVICNRAAGGVDDEAQEEILRELRAHAEVVVAGEVGGYPDHIPVVMGGDGSLHHVVRTLHERGELGARPIGLIPMGTGNDLARTAGITPDNAVKAVLEGQERPMDLLVDDRDGVVVNAVHVGVGAEASLRAQALKPVLSRLAYRVGALVAGVRARGWRLRVTVDGECVADGTRRVLMVGLGNGRTIGGGTPLAPRAEPGDGLVDVVVSFAVGPLQRLAFGVRLRRGEHTRLGEVRALRGRKVSISGQAVPVNADGELGAKINRRTWTVVPGAWRLLTP